MPRVSSHFGLRDPRLQSLVMEQIVPAAISADSATTLTPAQVLGGQIVRTGMTAGRTDTLPTAAVLAEAMQGVFVGLAFQFEVRNQNAGAFAQTLAVGTGGTLSAGSTATTAQNNTHFYRLSFTNATIGAEAYLLESLGTLAF